LNPEPLKTINKKPTIEERKTNMNIDDIKTIAVIGAGNMGHQISMLCAIHGYKTVCTDINK